MKKALVHFLSAFFAIVLVFALATSAMAASDAYDFKATTVAVIRDGENFLEFDTLEEAFSKSIEDDFIYLVKDVQIKESISIPEKRTLVVPSSDDLNDTVTGNNVHGYPASGSIFRTLTVESGATLTVNGSLLVAGNQACNSPYSGVRTGNYGAMTIEGNAAVVVANGGSLYARGLVSGDGAITALNGAKVYQMLQITDYRGGTVTTEIYEKLFPFSAYNLTNITCPITYEFGSELLAQYYVDTQRPITGNVISRHGNASVIASVNPETPAQEPNAFFIMGGAGSSVYMHGSEVRLTGSIKNGSFSITIPGLIFDHTISTAGLICPVYGMNVTVEKDSTLTISETLKFLPGTSLTVADGGAVNVQDGQYLYFYEAAQYDTNYTLGGYKGSMTNATLTVESGGKFSGTVGSSSDTMSNILVGETLTSTGYEDITELTQSGTTVTEHSVRFYTVALSIA